jgi:hypothetical protein
LAVAVSVFSPAVQAFIASHASVAVIFYPPVLLPPNVVL